MSRSSTWYGWMTYNWRGILDAWRNYPRQEHACTIPLYGAPSDQTMHPDRDGQQPSPRFNVPSASEPTIVGETVVGPFEVNVIAGSEQARHLVAGAAITQIATLSSELTRVDHTLNHELVELAAVQNEIKDRDLRAYAPSISPRLFWIVVAIALIAELPLNAAVMDAFGVVDAEAYVIAMILGVLNFVAAKYVARVIAQRAWERRDWGACALAVVTSGGVLTALFWLARVRESMPPAPLVVSDDGLTQITTAMVPGAPMALYAIQVVAFLAAIAWSYSQVDPNATREQLSARNKRIEQRADNLFKARVALAQAHNVAVKATETALSNLVHDCRQCIAQYRNGNLRTRSIVAPDYFLTAIPDNAFQPLQFGTPVDAQPPKMADMLARIKGETVPETEVT
jgi:hypothetical protein